MDELGRTPTNLSLPSSMSFTVFLFNPEIPEIRGGRGGKKSQIGSRED